jgi:hypothetical protein
VNSTWEIRWRDGFVEGSSFADDDADLVYCVDYILRKNHVIEMKIIRR